MKNGKRRHRVELQAPTVTQDDSGGNVSIWATYTRVYLDKRAISGREFMESDQPVEETRHRWFGKYKAEILQRHRIVERDGTEHEILHAAPLKGRRQDMEILTRQLSG